jgi:hypothetical protein
MTPPGAGGLVVPPGMGAEYTPVGGMTPVPPGVGGLVVPPVIGGELTPVGGITPVPVGGMTPVPVGGMTPVPPGVGGLVVPPGVGGDIVPIGGVMPLVPPGAGGLVVPPGAGMLGICICGGGLAELEALEPPPFESQPPIAHTARPNSISDKRFIAPPLFNKRDGDAADSQAGARADRDFVVRLASRALWHSGQSMSSNESENLSGFAGAARNLRLAALPTKRLRAPPQNVYRLRWFQLWSTDCVVKARRLSMEAAKICLLEHFGIGLILAVSPRFLGTLP